MVSKEKREKMNVEVRVTKMRLKTTEPKELWVQWKRGKDAIKTGTGTVDSTIDIVELNRKQGKFMITASFYQLGD